MRKIMLLVLAICLLIAIIPAGCIFFNAPPSDSEISEYFVVRKGDSVKNITLRLASDGYIRSSLLGYAYARFNNLSLKAGTYRLSPSMSMDKILLLIDEGREVTVRVTIPEGLSIKKIGKYLEKSGLVTAADFIAAASNTKFLEAYGIKGKTTEGFLFPDTYFFPYGIDAESIVSILVSTFFKKASSLSNFPENTEVLVEKVILASIVEREYRVSEEAPLIASVFTNRLKIGMGLQSCATVEYIITEILDQPHPEKLFLEDLEIRNDYNTYLWAGLPPGPISSPGLTALNAALNPALTDFLYFRLTDAASGTHSFTRSLDEHVKAGKSLVLKKVVAY